MRGSNDVIGLVAGYFPDHLVRRSATVTIDPDDPLLSNKRRWLVQNASRYLRVETPEGVVETESAHCDDVSLEMLAAMRREGIESNLHIQGTGEAGPHDEEEAVDFPGVGGMLRSMALKVHRESRWGRENPYVFAVAVDQAVDLDVAEESGDLERTDRVVTDGSSSHYLSVFSGRDLLSLGHLRDRLSSLPGVLHSGLAVPTEYLNEGEAVAVLAQSVGGQR